MTAAPEEFTQKLAILIHLDVAVRIYNQMIIRDHFATYPGAWRCPLDEKWPGQPKHTATAARAFPRYL